MKTKVFLLSMLAVLFAACEEKLGGSVNGSPNKVETISATDVTSSSALLTGWIGVDLSYYNSVEFGMLISEKESDLFDYNGKKLVGDTLVGQTFSVTAKDLLADTRYHYRAYVELNSRWSKQSMYGAVGSFTTEKGEKEGDHLYLDLGLSVKWALCNVGASKPEEYGDIFAWGETSPKASYSWSNYKWCSNGKETGITKYTIPDDERRCDWYIGATFIGDNKTTLELADDAAHVNWGGKWRMPTKAEQDELRNNCTWTWTTQNGVKGCLVKSKKNGNSIFLPAAGDGNSTAPLGRPGACGCYWSSSLSAYGSFNATYFFFDLDQVNWNSCYRYYPRTVRPVCP